MTKKNIAVMTLVVSMNLLANDNDDIKFIYKLFQNKDYKISSEELEKFVLKYPNSKNYYLAQNLLGKSLYELKEYDKAKKVFSRLLNGNQSSDANYYLALISIEDGNNDLAYNYSKNLKGANKDKIIYQLAIKEYQNNNQNKAKTYFEELIKSKGTFQNIALFNLGLISYNSGTFLDTTVYLDKYLKTEKDDTDKLATANYMLAYSYYKLNNIALALTYYETIEKKYPTSIYYPIAQRDLLLYWIGINDIEKASIYSEKLLNTEFEEVALQTMGNYYYNIQKYETAAEYYEKLLKKYKNSDVVYYLGKSYLSLDKKAEALDTFKKLSTYENYKYEYLYYVAYILFQDEKYPEVLEFLADVENKVDKDEVLFYQFVADSAYKTNDYKKAQKYYKLIFDNKKTVDDFYKYYLASSLNNDIKTTKDLYDYYRTNFPKDRIYNESIYLILGNAYAKLDEDLLAEEVYIAGLKVEYSEQITENLVTVELNTKKYDAVIKNLDRLKDTDENLYIKGTTYMAMKKNTEASSAFEKLIGITKNKDLKIKTLVKLAEVYLAEKNYNKVIETASKYESLGFVNNKDLMKIKALAYFRMGSYDEARKVYVENGNDFYMIAETYYNQNEYKLAKENYIKAYETSDDAQVKKDSSYWLIRIEQMLDNKKELFERVAAFRKLYVNSEYEEDITYLVAKIYEEDNDIKNAIIEYVKLYSLTTNEDTKDQMAESITELYYKDKDTKNSLIWCNKVSDKGYKTLWQGYNWELDGKIDLANKNYEKLIDDKDFGDSANYKLGLYYLNKNDYKKSRTYFENVLNFPLSENAERAQYNIGLTYEKEKDFVKAISSFLKIKLLTENSSLEDLILIKLGENYEKLDDADKSFEYFKEYSLKYNTKKEYAYVIEKLLVNRLNNAKPTEAKAYYIELNKINPSAAKAYAESIK